MSNERCVVIHGLQVVISECFNAWKIEDDFQQPVC